MKKARYLPVLLVAVFLLLCACAQQQSSQASSDPDTLSSIPSSSTPSSSIPVSSVPATSVPATTPPSTAPTQPNLDWLTDREIVPFEDRFKEDVPFGNCSYEWLVLDVDSRYNDYNQYRFHAPYFDVQYKYYRAAEIVWEHGMETEYIYQVPTQADLSLLADFSTISADGRWAYLCSDDELCKLELLTGELTTLATKNEGDIRWEVQACGKDTVCIFQLDAERNLRIYYRDLHSEAERTIHQGVLPDGPTSENDLLFYASSTTQGEVYWEMQNPAFREVYLQERNDPNSPLKNSADLYLAVQEHYNIPILVRYSCDFHTGALTEDFGLYDTCWQTKDCKHDHFGYENTKEEVTVILDVAPVEIPDIGKPEGDDIWYEVDTALTFIYSEFGYGQPYLTLDSPIWKLADFAVTQSEISSHFAYFITTEGTIVQFDYTDKNYKTIYTSENELSELFWCTDYLNKDHLYFVDGNTIVCIDTIAGTYRPIIQTNLDEIYIIGEEYIYYPRDLYFGVRQGMYYKEYRYYPETGELKEEQFIP